ILPCPGCAVYRAVRAQGPHLSSGTLWRLQRQDCRVERLRKPEEAKDPVLRGRQLKSLAKNSRPASGERRQTRFAAIRNIKPASAVEIELCVVGDLAVFGQENVLGFVDAGSKKRRTTNIGMQ